jgi:hypothetical protein
MSNALQAGGAQPDKQTRFAPLYTGRFFSGIWTNRSPLRDAASTRIEEKFYGPRGDALIAGSNVEITNRLTLGRRPGNPVYDNVNTFTDVLSFDDFRISKGLSDVFGTVTEQVDTMIDTSTALYAENSDFVLQGGVNPTTVFTKSPGAGQSYGIQVGNEWYFGDGADNKKWLQSLFVRTSASNNATLNLNSYPFMDTFLISNPTTNPQIQQLIGAAVQSGPSSAVNNINVIDVVLSDEILTLTTSAAPFTTQPIGTQFMLWGFTNPATTFLNGSTITLTVAWSGTTITANWGGTHESMSQADTAVIQIESGGTNSVTNTLVLGPTVPTWGTVAPSASNDFMGSVTIDGQSIWVNRGITVENWGLAAPTEDLISGAGGISLTGAASGFSPNTFYAPASVFIDPNGNLWEVTTGGKSGATEPAWPASPTFSVKHDIFAVSVAANVATVYCTTLPSPGQSVTLFGLQQANGTGGAPDLNGVTLTVATTGANFFTAPFTFSGNYPLTGDGADQGYAIFYGTTQADGSVIWTSLQSAASMVWTAHTHYHQDDFLVNPVGSSTSLFQLSKNTQPFIQSDGALYSALYPTYNSSPTVGSFNPIANPITINAWDDNSNPARGFNGAFSQSFTAVPTSGSVAVSTPVPGSLYAVTNSTAGGGPEQSGPDVYFFAINGAGEIGASTDSGQRENWESSFICKIYIPAPGTYTFTLLHDDGAFFSFDNTTTSAYKTNGSGTNIPPTFSGSGGKTAIQGYTGVAGNNNSGVNTDSATWVFPTAGDYTLEINWKAWENQQEMIFTCQSFNLASNPDESGSNQPAWPAFTTAGATGNVTTGRITFGTADTVLDAGGQYTWSNLGPSSAYKIWYANTFYTVSGTPVIDTNGNEQLPIQPGVTGTTAPIFNGTLNGITTLSGSTLQFINSGSVPIQPNTLGKITATSAQGWVYGIALVNTLDNTVSNIGPVGPPNSAGGVGTGPLISGQVTFSPGAGLPSDLTQIDPQADYVAIFRTTDGFSTLLLIPSNGNTDYTVPLTQYIQSGYVDITPDTGLDTLIQAAAAGENTPPLPGAVNLTYHLNRIWYSIGNTVYYTTGPLAPVGNGINGTSPLNFDPMTSTVTRLFPTSIGLIVFTISDIYIIANSGGTILPSLPYVPGVGLSSYNAFDSSGPLAGFFSTDHQFINFNPSAGVNIVSMPIGDQFRKNTGVAPTAWDPKNVYVAWYVNGEDMGWFVADGVNGWFRLINNPAPDFGQSWSPFATIANGVKAIKAVETSPGVHNLLLGPAANTPVNPSQLGVAGNYALLAYSGITNTGSSVISGGNVGTVTATVTPGAWTLVPPSVIDNADAAAAEVAAVTAYNFYAAMTPTKSGLSNLSVGGNGSTASTYTAGVYAGASSLSMPTGIILDGQGNTNSMFVFQAGSTVNLASGQSVTLINGAQASNVFWVVGSSLTTVATSTMVGTILAQASVTLGGGVFTGRVLAGISGSSGAVTISAATTITASSGLPTGSGFIRYRNLDASSDGGTGLMNGLTYPAYAVFGSYVLAQPGQVAEVMFITTDSVNVGSPLILGLLIDEALPYYTGSFEMLKNWVSDPPGLPPSKSILGQRFYLAETDQPAALRHLQVMCQWPSEAALNELQSFTIYGAFVQEA